MVAGMLKLLVLAMVALATGCTHDLQVRNLSLYQSTSLNPLDRPCTIGIVPGSNEADVQKLVRGVGTALGRYGGTVLFPYHPSSARKVDVVAHVSVRPEYKGSGWNFLINWPGFLIFTPAWHGYDYEVNYEVEVLLAKGTDATRIDSWIVPLKLDVRHADISRTWTEVGWLEVGLIPLVGGLFFLQYDPDVTPLLVEKIENPIGDYIAQDIVNRINNRGAMPESVSPGVP